MIDSILVEAIVKKNYIKLTVTSDNKLRIKVPTFATQDDINAWTQVGVDVFNRITPVDRTFRGTFRTNDSHVTMYNDACTQSIRVDFA